MKELDSDPSSRNAHAIRRLKLLIAGLSKKRELRKRGYHVETSNEAPDSIRRYFTSFLAASWKRIPFEIDLCNPSSVRASNGSYSYHDIVFQVAKTIHTELFHGVVTISYGDPGFGDSVELPSIECMSLLSF